MTKWQNTTRAGRPVRVLCEDRDHERPIVSLIRMGEREELYHHHANGQVFMEGTHASDLMPEPWEGWMNLYPDQSSRTVCIHDTKEEALEYGSLNRIRTIKVREVQE